jgi:hypothetical protein
MVCCVVYVLLCYNTLQKQLQRQAQQQQQQQQWQLYPGTPVDYQQQPQQQQRQMSMYKATLSTDATTAASAKTGARFSRASATTAAATTPRTSRPPPPPGAFEDSFDGAVAGGTLQVSLGY